MATKEKDIQDNLVITDGLEDAPEGYIGFAAKTDGLYQKEHGLPEEKLMTPKGLEEAEFIPIHVGTVAPVDTSILWFDTN